MNRCFILFLLATVPVAADNVTEAIDQATTYYDDGQYQQAISQLDFAAQMIKQMRAAGIAVFLPEPLDDWTASEPEVVTAGAAMMGGGTTVSRNYTAADGASVSIQLITDSPMLSMFMTFLSNPMMAASQGGQLQMVNGQQALVKPDEITVVVSNTYMIQFQAGNGASAAQLLSYAQAFDYQGLATYQ